MTFVDCTTGAVIRNFPTMNTFNMGGTMLETPRSLAKRSPGHGTWERVRGNEYSSVFKFFRSNADGTDNGYQLVRRRHELNDGMIDHTATSKTINAAGRSHDEWLCGGIGKAVELGKSMEPSTQNERSRLR